MVTVSPGSHLEYEAIAIGAAFKVVAVDIAVLALHQSAIRKFAQSPAAESVGRGKGDAWAGEGNHGENGYTQALVTEPSELLMTHRIVPGVGDGDIADAQRAGCCAGDHARIDSNCWSQSAIDRKTANYQ